MDKYDVGIYGIWNVCNYGGIISYYALNRVISSLGKSVLMIDKPVLADNNDEKVLTHSRRFAIEHYKISERYSLSDMKKLNDVCDTFVIGSDQVWNYGISKNFGKSFYLDFVDDDKKKISYASSFGHGVDFAPGNEREKIAKLMSRFDGISVREEDGVRLCKTEYGIKAEQVINPVFLAEPSIYEPLIQKSSAKESEPFIAAYILDPTPEKREAIQYISKKLGGIKVVTMLDGEPHNFEKNKDLMGTSDCVENLQVEDWLYYISHCEYVVTDSCQGVCFALIFNKNFTGIINKQRGYSRFSALSKMFEVQSHIVAEPKMVMDNDNVFESINYKRIKSIMENERKRSLKWLKNVLNAPKKNVEELEKENRIGPANTTPVDNTLEKNPDFIKIRMIATLLRDYGVKHVVLSPGGRDVPLVRMFEYNEGTFHLHRVTDERSAAYFGLGIATQLRKPVACVCTSGTAVSNYLPAVTEAYYTGIPLIMITADRYNVYHEHGEDQTIPQQHIFDGVVKKSITVPEGSGFNVEYQTRRDVSDCILESTHNGFGPVQINIAIGNVGLGSKSPRSAWKLLPGRISPHILRVGLNSSESDLQKYVDALKRSQRILLVYGQNPPPNETQKKNIEEFAKKYNCVIVTDHISNLDCEYALKPHNMLAAISKQEFNETLSPDILITVGGKRLMNDPLTDKVRGGRKDIRHWSVMPDGRIKDFYFRLTSVIEMSQDRFFEYFATHAGDCSNNGQYLNKWRDKLKNYPSPVIENFTSNYIQSKFFPAIPPQSILHLGVGLSFYDCRRYSIDSSVEVYCNMGTNGIDGCTSTFMGQCSVVKDKLCFLIVGDLSFFYDMNSLWNKELSKNIRILMVNNNGSGLLRGHNLKGITSVHNTAAKGWVESTGFKYITASSQKEFDKKLPYFLSDDSDSALFFEVFCS